MPSKKKIKRTYQDALRDMRKNILLCQDFIAGIDVEAFLRSAEKIYAVVRCLEIISEASRRLPDELRNRHAHIPWQDIMSAGNVYRHGYEHIEELEIWHTASIDLKLLLPVVDAELQKAAPADVP